MRKQDIDTLEYYIAQRKKDSIKFNLSLAKYISPFFFKNGKRRKKQSYDKRDNFDSYQWCRNEGLNDNETNELLKEYEHYDYWQNEFYKKFTEEINKYEYEKKTNKYDISRWRNMAHNGYKM